MSVVAGIRLSQLYGEPQVTLVRRNGCFLPGNLKNPLVSQGRRQQSDWRIVS
jgi:hypothetical protein